MFNFFKRNKVEENMEINKDDVYANLSKELGENFWGIDAIFKSICKRYSIAESYFKMLSCNLEKDLFFRIFIDIYEQTKHINDLEEFNKIFDYKNSKKIIKRNFYLQKSIKFFYKFENNFDEIIDISFIKDKLIIGDYILKDNKWIEDYENKFKALSIGDKINNTAFFQFDLIIDMFHSIKVLNKILMLLRNKNKLIKNEDLYKIIQNLEKQFNYNHCEVATKLYPVYEKFYIDTFGSGIDIDDLMILLEGISGQDKMLVEKIDSMFLLLKDDIKKLMENIRNDTTSNNMSFNTITNNLNTFIKNINWEKFYYDSKLDDDDSNFYLLYSLIIYKLKDIIPCKLLMENYIKYEDVFNLYLDNKKERDLLKEKERFLKGDFSIENSIEEDKLEMENINTGVEFEEYLKTIFEKLKYTVEMTKTTGDQGADLILMKDNIKTVVQAKYYSSSVGNKAVQEVNSAIRFYNADKGMVVTNSYYTKSATELAKANNIVLIDGNELENIKMSIFNDTNEFCHSDIDPSSEDIVSEMNMEKRCKYLESEIEKYLINLNYNENNYPTLNDIICIYITIMKDESLNSSNLAVLKLILENSYEIVFNTDEEITCFISLVNQIYNLANEE